MKCLLAAVLLVSMVVAEPPRYSQLSGRLQAPPAQQSAAPYVPSGWKPQGARLTLPARQQSLPQKYGPPSPSYGPPTTTDAPTTTDIDFTEDPEVESFKALPQREEKENNDNTEKGQYYILLPDGRLQKVTYETMSNLRKMAYSARLRYQNVEPISGPIYTPLDNVPFVPYFQ